MSDILRHVGPMVPALRRYARGLVRDSVAADDLVQDCLERVVAHWRRRRNNDPRTWVFTILHNLAVNRLRQKARRGKHLPLEKVDAAWMRSRKSETIGLMAVWGIQFTKAGGEFPQKEWNMFPFCSCGANESRRKLARISIEICREIECLGRDGDPLLDGLSSDTPQLHAEGNVLTHLEVWEQSVGLKKPSLHLRFSCLRMTVPSHHPRHWSYSGPLVSDRLKVAETPSSEILQDVFA